MLTMFEKFRYCYLKGSLKLYPWKIKRASSYEIPHFPQSTLPPRVIGPSPQW